MIAARASDDLAEVIVEFCRYAREKGVSAGVQGTLGALEAAAALGGVGGEELKFGLRSVLCSSKDDWDLFDDCFREFWSGRKRESCPKREASAEQSGERLSTRRTTSLMAGTGEDSSSEEGGSLAVTGASARERLTKADLSKLSQGDMAALEQISMRLLKQMSGRLALRLRNGGLRGHVDLRRTIRRNISHGGEPINLRYRQRKPRPHRLVVLLDISGSMSAYSLFLVKFLYALQKYFRHVDTFLFSTRLVEVTSQLRGEHLQNVLWALAQLPAGWSGGTSIGGSLREFNQRYRSKLRSADTWFVILSDGWDTGEATVLAAELAAVKRRVRRIIWLNPLLGLRDYQPITSGMSAALPHIDVFAPAHNLESLLELEKHL
jgi:uncharacterized protein with von Willebrand factor type A (vWA) domain